MEREKQWRERQLSDVLKWLGAGDVDQELRLEWLRSRCFDGTSSWITNHQKFRLWLRRGRDNAVLWIHGKPGSGTIKLYFLV